MFLDKNKQTKSMEPSTSQNRINEGTELTGDIVSNGFFRIDGNVVGNISKPSRVVIGKNGSVNGKLICEDADIEGRFEGDLDVSGTLTLKATAHIEGEVVAGKLSVEPGATFNASCSMQGAKKTSSTPSSEEKANPYDRQQRLKKASEPLK
jgi:cytoskeletal protein CcmA (bactofilin family)